MPRVVWTRSARGDLIAIRHRLGALSPAAAERVGHRVRQRIADLKAHPEIGRPGRIPETRELVITDTDYLVIYVVDNGDAVLLAIVSGRQDR